MYIRSARIKNGVIVTETKSKTVIKDFLIVMFVAVTVVITAGIYIYLTVELVKTSDRLVELREYYLKIQVDVQEKEKILQSFRSPSNLVKIAEERKMQLKIPSIDQLAKGEELLNGEKD